MPSHQENPYDLARFVEAQAENHAEALAELRAERKRSHWSWYVLPQTRGLGSSPMPVHYAISGLDEAQAYLSHPVLGARLRESVAAMNAHPGSSAAVVLGDIEAKKFHSCVTLFAQVAEPASPFHDVLAKYCFGAADQATLAILARQAGSN